MTTQTLMPDVRPDLRRDVQQPQRAVTSRSAFPVRRALQVGVSLTVLVALLVLVLPSVTGASWESATKALASVSLWQLAGLTALWLIGLWAYSFVLAASLPGLSKGQGFVLNLVGSGASNLVPVLFRRAAQQKVMPTGLAVAAITTAGYAGVLLGPAGVGFVAQLGGLPMAFWLLTALMGLVTLTAQIVTAEQRPTGF